MDPISNLFSDFNGYYVALIIITIVTIAIGIALSFFFVFIPALRIEREFDLLEAGGEQAIKKVTDLINNTTALGGEIQKDVCQSVIYSINKLFGRPQVPHPEIFEDPNLGCLLPLYCLNVNPMIPAQCVQYINPDDVPACCKTTPCSCPGGCQPIT